MTKEQFERAAAIDNEIYRIGYRLKDDVDLAIRRIEDDKFLSEEARKKIVAIITADAAIDARLLELQKEFDAL